MKSSGRTRRPFRLPNCRSASGCRGASFTTGIEPRAITISSPLQASAISFDRVDFAACTLTTFMAFLGYLSSVANSHTGMQRFGLRCTAFKGCSHRSRLLRPLDQIIIATESTPTPRSATRGGGMIWPPKAVDFDTEYVPDTDDVARAPDGCDDLGFEWPRPPLR